jgi:hypothetical protein
MRFSSSGFYHDSVSSGPLYFIRAISKILRDIRNFVFIAGVNDTGDKLFNGVNGCYRR